MSVGTARLTGKRGSPIEGRGALRGMEVGVTGINKVGVVGLGTMGAGIVEVFARNGMSVIGVEDTATALERAKLPWKQRSRRK